MVMQIAINSAELDYLFF